MQAMKRPPESVGCAAASALNARRQHDGRRRTLHAVERADAVDQTIEFTDGTRHDDRDQVEGATDRMQRPRLLNPTQPAFDRRGLARFQCDQYVSAHQRRLGATVSGWGDGRMTQETHARRIYGQVLAGRLRSAIQVTTASSARAMLDMLALGQLPPAGFVRQEDVALNRFLANRFGSVFAPAELARAA